MTASTLKEELSKAGIKNADLAQNALKLIATMQTTLTDTGKLDISFEFKTRSKPLTIPEAVQELVKHPEYSEFLIIRPHRPGRHHRQPICQRPELQPHRTGAINETEPRPCRKAKQ